MCNRKRSKGRKSVDSGIKANACELVDEFVSFANACELEDEFVSFKNDHPCLKMDTFSMP